MNIGQRVIHPEYGKGVIVDRVHITNRFPTVEYYIIEFYRSSFGLGIPESIKRRIETFKPCLQGQYDGSNFMAIDSDYLYTYDLLIESDEHFKTRQLKEKYGEDYLEYLEG